MTDPASVDPTASAVDRVIAEFFAAESAGQRPDPAQLIDDHPELAVPLRSFFENYSRFRRAMPREPASAPPSETLTNRALHESATHSETGPNRLSPRTELGCGSILGPYRIVAKLGEGGMGTVYKALHEHLDKPVALKILPLHFTAQPEAVARFKREMKAVGKLEHPNIVRAYDAGEIDGVYFLAMEYVDGLDLAKLVIKKGPLSVVNACKAIRQAALGLSAAHQAGLIHRDLKPSNLLASKNGPIKLLDLGLARLGSDVEPGTQLTTAGQIFGTPDYMAPEQWEDPHAADERSDLYALGCTLHYLLMGTAPFAAEQSIVGKMKAHATALPPDLQTARSDVPEALAQIHRKLLAKSAAVRYQTAAEVADALWRFTSVRTDAAISPSLGSPTQLPLSNVAKDATGSSPQFPHISEWEVASSAVFLPPKSRSYMGWKRQHWITFICCAAVTTLLGIGMLLMSDQKNLKTSSGKRNSNSSTGLVQKPTKKEEAITVKHVGWYEWRAGAPQPAKAPFSQEEARDHQLEWARYLKVSSEFTNSIGMEFALIPPGEFVMGSPPDEIEAALISAGNDEGWQGRVMSGGPQHQVALTRPVFMAIHEVTQSQYQSVMSSNPSHFSESGAGQMSVINRFDSSTHPVEMVSWLDAVDFCLKLSEREKLSPCYRRDGENVTPLPGSGYRLPTEAEWEFACRAGTSTTFWISNWDEPLPQAGWTAQNSDRRTHAVGKLKANAFGLYDVHGNVWEWVQDWFDSTYYGRFRKEIAINPIGPAVGGALRVMRGGCWDHSPPFCRASFRDAQPPSRRHEAIGFRVLLPIRAGE